LINKWLQNNPQTAIRLLRGGKVNSNRQLADNSNVSHLQLAEVALQRYALEGATLTLISEVDNALYQVSLPAAGPKIHHPYLGCVNGLRLLLRIEESAEHRVAATYSELVLLATLLRDTELDLPEPVPTASGELVPELWVEGMEQPHQCVLFRWAGSPFPEQAMSRASSWHAN
jgi:Ser/Thr protein kinase RdoA (MazF antagonist)